MDIILYTVPVSCSKVPLILLEEIGVSFETRLVHSNKGEHKSPGFKRINPKGKVPAIVIDGETLTENVAIAVHLNELFPDAGLLPKVDVLGRARQIADLCFCSATLHPFVSRICVPWVFVEEAGMESVQRRAMAGIAEYLQIIEDRLAEGPWWYGQTWSAMDPYIYWVFTRIGTGSDFDTAIYPRLMDHADRMEKRPAVKRALAREAVDQAILKEEKLMKQPDKAG